MSTHTITSVQPNTRFDIYVLKLRPTLSRNAVKNLIRDGVITLNNERTKPNIKVTSGDIVTFDDSAITKYASQNDKAELKASNLHLQILHEDDDIVAVDKPVGMVAHPDSVHRDDSVLNGLLHHVHSTNQKNTRIRMIHRLDKATSGVILAAKNLQAHEYYSAQFAEGRIDKTYALICKGKFLNYARKHGDGKSFTVETYLSYQKDNQIGKSRSVVTDNTQDDRAATEFELIEASGKYTFAYARPKTGRTHQIRVHAKHIGCPIVGDTLYGGENKERLMLHALSLKFTDMQGKSIKVEAELPDNFFAD